MSTLAFVNYFVLEKILQVVGRAKALEVFKETQRIEAEGGMMIMVWLKSLEIGNLLIFSHVFQNQTRRRTPGGVFLFLVRHDSGLTREQLGKIFDEEKQKYKEVMKIKKKKKHNQMKMKNG